MMRPSSQSGITKPLLGILENGGYPDVSFCCRRVRGYCAAWPSTPQFAQGNLAVLVILKIVIIEICIY